MENIKKESYRASFSKFESIEYTNKLSVTNHCRINTNKAISIANLILKNTFQSKKMLHHHSKIKNPFKNKNIIRLLTYITVASTKS